MSSISGLLNIAREALMTSQAELDTTSHNIANANTDGYTKQKVVTEAATPIQTTYGFLGSGVQIESVESVRDAFVDQQVTNSNSDLSQATIEQQTMSNVESIFNDSSGDGLSDQLNALFSAFQSLAQSPEDSGVRQTVMQAGQQVATTFNVMNNELQNIEYQVGQEINSDVGKINQLSATIADINSKILASGGASKASPDLQDEMDNSVSQLSGLVNVKVTTDPTGVTNVTAGGTVIVAAGTAYAFKATQTSSGITVGRSDSSQSATISSGELSGLLSSYNGTISSFANQLDNIANTLVQTVNAFHSTGYTLSTNGTPAQTGEDFFVGNSAGSIAVSSDIVSNLNNIAASSSGDPGDGGNATAIANVLNAPVMSDGQSIVNEYQGLVGQVGIASQQASDSVQTLQVSQNQMTAFQNSISGVSLDEELTNMIQYQHSFEAAAKVVTTTDAMYETIIGMVT
jgi:flagellar hook-associated protein 1 FlgK